MRSEEYRVKLDRLLDSRMQRLSGRAHKFCIRFGLPRLHVCLFDRHCREFDSPMRLSLLWRRHMWWVDFVREWPPIQFGRYKRP